ncbi:MAG TPA: POTRA domain-containing protein [Vicinamibacterales bacterium]|nr:POTRA domain-containing protein [Vicinamibacterales bacterium]
MARSFSVLFTALVVASAVPLAAQTPSPAPETVRSLRVVGAKELSEADVARASRVVVGEALSSTLEQLRDRIERHYRDEGYTFARATPTFDDGSGTLTITVDEGVIDAVEFEGLDDKLKAAFNSDFALRAGDVFNRSRAVHALDALLQQTRGAVRRSKRTFNVIDRDGQRVLIVGLREPAGRFNMVPDLGDREDWFTPVDGFVPSLGFGAAVFDHASFNHAFVAGHISARLGSNSVGYALGFERPFFSSQKLYIGGELRDLTASDDQWQLSSTEASLAAIGPRKSFRDYYRRRGLQISSAYRVLPNVEFLGAWRNEREEPLTVQSDFSVWNSDDPFRTNRAALDGRLSSIVIGATASSDSFERESLESTYRRHQLDSLFGQRVHSPEGENDMSRRWRVDWTSEISKPGALQSDFDFQRHIVAGRAELPLSTHQDFNIRAIGGWSDGVLPPQRQFAVGGIGSVHGYDFKEQIGDTMALLNMEYTLGDRTGLRAIGFMDVGKATFREDAAHRDALKGVGFGIGVGDCRLDFGYKLNAVPSSLQVTLRFVRTF